MEEPGGSRARARAAVEAWVAAIGRRRTAAWPEEFEHYARRLREVVSQWAIAEVAPGRLVPWLAIAFGSGIVVYFTADHEPSLWAAGILFVLSAILAFSAHTKPVGFPLVLGLAAAAAGFTTATLKSALIAHPVLQFPASGVSISGFVEVREEREKSDRIVVRVHRIEGRRLNEAPDRVRVAVRKNTAPAVGTFVEFKARLSPPLPPLRPGGYDFARDLYFQRIGASGFALGAIKTVEPPALPGIWLRYASVIDAIREAIDKRIRAVVPGDQGSIASALITGKRDAITIPVNDAMYISSLAHVLSISGYHMAVVAGIVFFFVRALLALVPGIASRSPIKKWAAFAALATVTFYLLLSGAEVATQRSFIMIAIVLIGVMVDRPAVTFRTLTVAAIGVLLLAPEAVVHPSFQMSFAATLALVAGYQLGLPWKANADSSFGARAALWGAREIIGLVLASLVAGLATTPYAAYHFHRLAPYGVLANLLAMPVVSAWVMPMGILGVIAMPFGFDAIFWQLMGVGLDWMIFIALWVTSLPGAVGRMQAFGTGPLLLGTLGMVVLCLLRTPLRWAGAAIVLIACVWATTWPRPDVLIAADGQAAAVRVAGGRLSILHGARESFAVREWLAADADARTVKDGTLGDGVRCDEVGCLALLPNGRRISVALLPEAFEEDCERVAIVASPREAPAACSAILIDRKVWRRSGAMALRWNGNGFDASAARPPGYDRPWSRAPAVAPETAAAPVIRPAPRDATPKQEDLEPGD